MYKKIYMVAILAIMALYSCKKDTGNYDYKTINKAQQFNDLSDTVNSIVGQKLILKPKVTFTLDQSGDTTKYTYDWVYINNNKLTSIAKTAWLNINLSLVAGNYKFYYRVTDKETGIQFSKEFILKVVNEINEGWLLMCDVNGTARLDFLSFKNNKFTPIQDLLAVTSSGLQLKGKPKMVYTYEVGIPGGPGIPLSYGLYLSTDQGTNRIDGNTFKWLSNYDIKYEVLGALPSGFFADAIEKSGYYRSYMLGAGNVYFYNRVVNVRYSVPINFIDADKASFKIAPFIATDEAADFEIPAIFYDITNKRFVKHVDNASSCTVLPAGSNTLFNYTTGKDLSYMAWVPFNGGEVFSILKDAPTGKSYLARFNGVTTVQSYYAEIMATDFNKAEHFAVSPDLGYIFYSVGSKVYEYDMSLKTTKLMLDKGTNPITMLKFHVFKSYYKYTDVNKLIVCSYDPALPEGSNGKMEQYTVPPINGDLKLYHAYSGFGKVQSLDYRER